MNIPFADLLTKAKTFFARPPKNSGPLPMLVRPDKPESDKFAKTVVPNAVQTLTPEASSSFLMSEPTPRIVSIGRTGNSAMRDLPPAVALALEPRVERVLSLALSDLVDQIPDGYLKPSASFDSTRRVLLKAADVEKGMALGRPTISVSAIYQQMPEIFMHVVPPGDSALVPVPFDQLLSELSQLSQRDDQTSEQVVQQFETPFLQVTMEDTKKFGTTMAPVTIAEMPEVSASRMTLATAESLAAAAPDSAVAGRFVPSTQGMASRPTPELRSAPPPLPKTAPPIALQPNIPAPIAVSPPPAETQSNFPAPISLASAPKPISLSPSPELPPASEPKFGTGESAFPRVPASSGPPVPSASPVRIPFEVPAPTPKPAAEELGSFSANETPASIAPAATDGPQVTLPLRPILESLPPMQLNGDPKSVPAAAEISFPFARIAPQLMSGKIAIPPKDFHAALPAEFRALFLPDAVEAAVPLSLPDVLANLPGNALQMRGDQEEHTQDEIFETPFSQKADEDAKRLEVDTEKLKAQSLMAPPETKPALATAVPEARIEPAPATRAKETEPTFDAKAAVAKANSLPGVTSCAVTFVDGLSVAGNIPDELGLDGLSAVAPTLLQKLSKHMLETKLGALTAITVHGEKSPVTFFSAGNICLTAVHGPAALGTDTQKELASITKELSHTYAQPETEHVDH